MIRYSYNVCSLIGAQHVRGLLLIMTMSWLRIWLSFPHFFAVPPLTFYSISIISAYCPLSRHFIFIPSMPSIPPLDLYYATSLPFRAGFPLFIPLLSSIPCITWYFHHYASLSGLHITSPIGLSFSPFVAIIHLVPSSSALLRLLSSSCCSFCSQLPTHAVILYSKFKPFSSKFLPFSPYSFQYNKILF